MLSRQRDEPSSLSGTPASSSSNSTSNAVSTGVSPDATDTTLTTKGMTKTGTKNSDTDGKRYRNIKRFAGLILLFVAVVVFFHRRKRRDPDPDPAPPTLVAQTNSSVPLEQSSGVRPRPTGLAALPNRCRLKGKSDSEVRQDLVALGFFIRHHAQSSDYHFDTILAGADTLHESLRPLQLSEGTRHTVVRLSIDPSTREVGIRHLLALVIFQNLDTHSVGSLSLLPPALKELFKSLPKASEESQDPRVEPALVVWNRLTAFLMHHNPQGLSPLRLLPSVESQVKTLATLLRRFLMHFARTGDDGSSDVQQTRLENLITACVEFGYAIFSDPYDWKFIFSQEEREVLVMPGLEKLRNDMGELYDSPRVLLAPKVVTADLMED
ncbi:hypothetical protein CEP52_008325 [Fusarium oligoseptatum]|uniref:Uncharacterized protein n=1 Tax=Fusarium oligoseptatum TaxID=2604345 RepID=A0A428TII2_9HYPO|nr:hypothetical protein CEP52_008325 [Fusarium oligoseptatum]